MSLSKQNTQILIGLVVMGLSLSTCLFSYRSNREVLGITRAMQVFATAILIYGILSNNPSQKAQMLLIWLGTSSLFCTALIYLSVEYAAEYGFKYYRLEDLFAILLPLPAAAGVAYMMTIIYKGYVELTQDTVELQELNQQPPHEANIQRLLVSSTK